MQSSELHMNMDHKDSNENLIDSLTVQCQKAQYCDVHI